MFCKILPFVKSHDYLIDVCKESETTCISFSDWHTFGIKTAGDLITHHDKQHPSDVHFIKYSWFRKKLIKLNCFGVCLFYADHHLNIAVYQSMYTPPKWHTQYAEALSELNTELK